MIDISRYQRPLARLEQRKILLVCEGEKTEKYYFNALISDKALVNVVEVVGAGRGKMPLVQKACEEKLKAVTPYSHIWCVLDRDGDNDEVEFNNVLREAKRNHIDIAYSNDCFELWYVLHFERHNQPWHRSMYPAKLTQLLHRPYAKNNEMIYSDLLDKQVIAIEYAQELLDYHMSISPKGKCNPALDNPSTNVHQLVKMLNEYLGYNSYL